MTRQEIELRKAAIRIDTFVTGGWWVVLISRGIVGAFVVAASIVLLWQGSS